MDWSDIQSPLFTLPRWDVGKSVFVETMFPHSRAWPVLDAICFSLCLRCHVHQRAQRSKKKKATIFAFNFRQFLITYVQWKFDFQNIVDYGLIIFHNCILNSKSYWIFSIKVWNHWIKSLHTILVAESCIMQNGRCYTISKSCCKPH